VPAGASGTRERPYEHIRAGARRGDASEEPAKQIGARRVNKKRARSGEARRTNRTSTSDISSGRRGGRRSGRGSGGPTYDRRYI
jgi:hypothetical protein